MSERVPAEHAKAILARGEWVPAVCDPAGQAVSQRDGATLVELYAAAGLHLTMADNSVEAGIMLMLERLQSGRLKVFADLLPWWHEFRLYARDARGRVVKRDDHLLDATRYALVSGLPLARAAVAQGVAVTFLGLHPHYQTVQPRINDDAGVRIQHVATDGRSVARSSAIGPKVDHCRHQRAEF
ncbi:MAG: hypothetical protein EBR79_04195, partial [Proteobacteria bacterium]|nr:hypothetical protein [Pseudomonadota bacterium]